MNRAAKNSLLPAAALALILALLLFLLPSPAGSDALPRERVRLVERALRGLLAEERPSIRRDAPFAYEEDTFAPGIAVLGPAKAGIGSWQVSFEGDRAHARIEKTYTDGERFDSEVIEVDLVLRRDNAEIADWKALRTWGRIAR